MTKLDAVNRILRAVGQAGVAATDPDGNSEASQAERHIDDVELEVQARGWNYNSRVAQLTPNAITDKIAVPVGAIYIDSTREDEWRNIIHLAGFLYDADNNVDTFDGPLWCAYVLRYAFECIPYPVRNYIADRAAMSYNENHGNPARQVQLAKKELRSRAAAFRYDNSSCDVNIVKTMEALKIKGMRIGTPAWIQV